MFCQGKPDPYLVEIMKRFYERDGEVLGTRASAEQFLLVKEVVPEIEYDAVSRILKVEKKDKERTGCVAVCTGGTADIPVAEEAAQTAEYFGCAVDRIYDVGVAGIHRLLSQRGSTHEGKLHHCGWPEWRGSGNGSGRPGGLPCDCGSDISRLRCQLPRSFSPPDHVGGFLRERDFRSKYR